MEAPKQFQPKGLNLSRDPLDGVSAASVKVQSLHDFYDQEISQVVDNKEIQGGGVMTLKS